MALVQCRECGKMVSEEADVCPYCGAKMPSKKRKQRRLFISIILLLILAGGMIWTYFHFATNTQQANGGSTSAPSKIQKDIPVKEQVMQKDYEEKDFKAVGLPCSAG